MALKFGRFSAGEKLGGLAELGEYLGQPEDLSVRPTVAELFGRPEGKSPIQPGGPGKDKISASKLGKRTIWDYRKLKPVRTIATPSRQFIITPRLVGSVKAIKLDTGLTNRQDIAIWNVSTSVIWINTNQSVAANVGAPLGPSAPGAFNGAAVMANLTEEVEFWGIAGTAGNNLVIVMEAAI